MLFDWVSPGIEDSGVGGVQKSIPGKMIKQRHIRETTSSPESYEVRGEGREKEERGRKWSWDRGWKPRMCVKTPHVLFYKLVMPLKNAWEWGGWARPCISQRWLGSTCRVKRRGAAKSQGGHCEIVKRDNGRGKKGEWYILKIQNP